MDVPITAALAKSECPAAYRRICAKLAKAKQIGAGLRWSYRWAERIDGPIAEPRTADAAVAARVKRVCGGMLIVGRHSEAVDLTPTVMAHVEKFAREQFAMNAAEVTRIGKLTDAEREAELEDVLGKLRGTPGFMELGHLVDRGGPSCRRRSSRK